MPSASRRGGAGTVATKTLTRPVRSLADRLSMPTSRNRLRSASPRRSDVSGPAPEGVDRYVPGQRSRSPRRAGREVGRRPGARRDDSRTAGGRGGRGAGAGAAPRPKKTQEELDAEMDDYWGSGNNAVSTASGEGNVLTASANGGANVEAGGTDDIDMIE